MKTFSIEQLIRPNVAAMQSYSSARSEFDAYDDDEIVLLDANENPYENGLNRYPDPLQKKLKKALFNVKGIAPKNIMIGNGSDEVLDLLFRAFCEPTKDNIITLPPTYGMYGVLAQLNHIENKKVLLSSEFIPDVDAILSAVDEHTKIIFLCSPNNPTGNSFSEKIVERILTEFNGIVLLDEAYIDFSSHLSWLKRLDEFPNLVVIQTLSKAYGLAGIRIGCCFASEAIISVLHKIKPPYNVNTLSQQRAVKRLQNLKKVRKEIQYIKENKRKLEQQLIDIHFIKKVYPTEANFILVKVDDAPLRYEQLKKKEVVVRNRSSEPQCENTLRITVGTSEENRILIKALQDIQK